jgi:hypothetical protein
MKREDAAETITATEIDIIYAEYAEAKISIEAALKRLAALLDSKGSTEPDLIAHGIIKDWSR